MINFEAAMESYKAYSRSMDEASVAYKSGNMSRYYEKIDEAEDHFDDYLYYSGEVDYH